MLYEFNSCKKYRYLKVIELYKLVENFPTKFYLTKKLNLNKVLMDKSVWTKKGATLSYNNAMKEYKLCEEELVIALTESRLLVKKISFPSSSNLLC